MEAIILSMTRKERTNPGIIDSSRRRRIALINATVIDDETRAKIEMAQKSGPLSLANSLGIDEVVDPRELRNALIAGLSMTQQRPTQG